LPSSGTGCSAALDLARWRTSLGDVLVVIGQGGFQQVRINLIL
jgi:hypothetical protein